MNTNTLVDFIFHFLPQAIFKCSLLSVLLLLIMWCLKSGRSAIERQKLIEAVNIAMLIAGLLTFAILVFEFYSAYFSGTEYYQYNINRATGPYWWAFWIQLIAYQLLPQLFWIRRFRRSVYASLFIVLPQLVLYIFNFIIFLKISALDTSHVLLYFTYDWRYNLKIWSVYLLLILFISFINKRRLKTIQPNL